MLGLGLPASFMKGLRESVIRDGMRIQVRYVLTKNLDKTLSQ